MRTWDWVIGLLIIVILVIGVVAVAVTWFVPPVSILAFVAIVSALFAAISAFGAWFTIREMRLDRISRTQPFVLVDFEGTSSGAIYCTIRNLGAGIAKNVCLEFSPVPIDFRDRRFTDLSIFQEAIPILSPGAEIRQFFHMANRLFERDVPRAFQVTVKYQGEGGFDDARTFDIDLEQYRDMTLPPKTVEDHLAQLNDTVSKLAHPLNRVIRGDSLIVETHEQWEARVISDKRPEEASE